MTTLDDGAGSNEANHYASQADRRPNPAQLRHCEDAADHAIQVEMIGTLLICASLIAVDGDTNKCNDANMRDTGDRAPFLSGYEAPDIVCHTSSSPRSASFIFLRF